MSEDSGSCTSSRDVSPAGKLRRRRRRERRLPTFINLGNGTTPTAGRRGGDLTTASSSPAVTQRVGECFYRGFARMAMCVCSIQKTHWKWGGGVYVIFFLHGSGGTMAIRSAMVVSWQ